MKGTAEFHQPKASAAGEIVVFDAGAYPAKLVEMFLVSGKKFESEELQLECVFMWEIEEGVSPLRDGFNAIRWHEGTPRLKFQNDRKYVNKFQLRLEALHGAQLSENGGHDVDFEVDCPDWVENFEDLLAHLSETDDNGKPRRAKFKFFRLDGRDLIGQEAVVNLTVAEKNVNGQKREFNKVGNITAVPRRTSSRRTAPAPIPMTPPEDEQERLMEAPSRRRATTEPDLPF